MIQERDANDLSGLLQPASDLDVGWGWCERSGGMIVGHDDAGGAIPYRVSEHFARMDGATVHQADGDDPDV